MNTLIFLCGCGVGCLAACVVFIFVLASTARSMRESCTASTEHLQETERLLKERNGFNERIAKATENVATWCDHNWDKAKS